MEQRHLVLVDEQSQAERLKRISTSLRGDGIELIYKEINPEDYQTRLNDEDVVFDKHKFIQALREIPFIHHLDMFATDYNLIDKQLKGIDVIRIFAEIKPFFKKRVVIYSAQIEGVISDILKGGEDLFEEQCDTLKLLTRFDIDYMKSEGEFEKKFKSMLEKEPDITIDTRIIESLQAINNERIQCSIPLYKDKSLREISEILLSRDPSAILLRKEIVDHVLAVITKINGYE